METGRLLFALLFCFTSLYLDAQPDAGLVAHYSFDDGQLANEVDFYSDGEARGAPLFSKGVLGDALLFEGGPNEIIFTGPVNDFLRRENEFTLSFYFRSDDLTTQRSLMGKRHLCKGFNMFDIRVGRRMAIELYERERPLIRSNISVEIPDQRWHHYVYVRERFMVRLYRDGRLEAVKRFGYPIYIKDRVPFAINASPCKKVDGTGSLKGGLDELSIYGRALYSEEVSELYRRNRQKMRAANSFAGEQAPPRNPQLLQLFGTYSNVEENGKASLQLTPRDFTLTIRQPEGFDRCDELIFKGRYRIKAGQLYLYSGDLNLKGANTADGFQPYQGPEIIGEIYGEEVTIDLFAFDTRLKLKKQK